MQRHFLNNMKKFLNFGWVLPAFLVVATFLYFPIFQNIFNSFFKYSGFNPKKNYVGVQNYLQAFHDPIFKRALFNNISYALISVICQVFLALVLAAILEETVGKKLRGFLRTIYFIPATISTTVAGILFSFVYHPQIGFINSFLAKMHLTNFQHAWLGEQATAIWAIITMSQWQNLGYTTMLFIVAIQSIPREINEAAQVDGAGKVRCFFKITIPLVREMTTLMIIVTVSGAFLVFNEIMATTQGGPANSTQTLGTWLYTKAFMMDDLGYASAIATIVFLITSLTAIIQLRLAHKRRVSF